MEFIVLTVIMTMNHTKRLDFKKIKTIAIVGLSDKPDRPSYKVGKYLLEKGFKIRMIETPHNSLSVDTAEDLALVENQLSQQGAA